MRVTLNSRKKVALLHIKYNRYTMLKTIQIYLKCV